MSVFGCKNMELWTPESKNRDHLLSPIMISSDTRFCSLNSSSIGCRSCVILCGIKRILQINFWPSRQEIPGLPISNILWHLKNNERSAVMSIVTRGSPDVMSQRLFGNVIATFGIYTRASSKVFPPPGLLGFVTVHLVKVKVFPFCIIPPQSSRPLGRKSQCTKISMSVHPPWDEVC